MGIFGDSRNVDVIVNFSDGTTLAYNRYDSNDKTNQSGLTGTSYGMISDEGNGNYSTDSVWNYHKLAGTDPLACSA
jgi:hypothetical protein